MKKQSLKKWIWERLENGQSITDSDVAKFLGKEPNFYTVSVYSEEYRRLENAKEYFKQYETHSDTVITNYKSSWTSKHYLQNETLIGENKSYRISKNYYDYLKAKGVKTLIRN